MIIKRPTNKIKVVLLGSTPLCIFAYKILLKSPNVQIVGLVTQKPNKNVFWKNDPFFLPKVKKLRFNKLENINFDLGISINWTKKIHDNLLKLPKYGFINVHNSYKNIIKGRNIATHSILLHSKFKKSFYGSTLHFMTNKIDDGKIIDTKKVNISIQDNSWSLYKKGLKASEDIIIKNLINLRFLKKKKIFQKPKKTFLFKSKDLPEKNLSKFMPDNRLKIFNLTRALEFPNKTLPYILKDKKKLFLTTMKTTKTFIKIDSKKSIYINKNNINLKLKKW